MVQKETTMKVKNPKEPANAKAALHSLELNLRPLPHPVLGKREVIRGQRIHGETDEQLLLRAHMTLVGMLGYRDIGWSAYAALAAEVINQMPEEYRRLAVNLIITGDAMNLTDDHRVERVRKYEGLVELTPKKGVDLWTPGQPMS